MYIQILLYFPPTRKDGYIDFQHASEGPPPVARDVYGFALHYFDNATYSDYAPVNRLSPGVVPSFAKPNTAAFTSLYNGNIGAMSVNLKGLEKGNIATPNSTNAKPLLYNYRYDQLNRIKSMDAYEGMDNATNTWTPVHIDDYKESISYDPNGNIMSYTRNGNAARLNMDNLGYYYTSGTNQLNKVTDAAPDVAAGEYSKYNDIKQGQGNDNYFYDAIGNLIADASEGITEIKWTAYGKIGSIRKSNNMLIEYSYDAAGKRITKKITNPPTGTGSITIYTRDASGNVMSVYEKQGTGAVVQTETHMYGSSTFQHSGIRSLEFT